MRKIFAALACGLGFTTAAPADDGANPYVLGCSAFSYNGGDLSASGEDMGIVLIVTQTGSDVFSSNGELRTEIRPADLFQREGSEFYVDGQPSYVFAKVEIYTGESLGRTPTPEDVKGFLEKEIEPTAVIHDEEMERSRFGWKIHFVDVDDEMGGPPVFLDLMPNGEDFPEEEGFNGIVFYFSFGYPAEVFERLADAVTACSVPFQM